VYKRGNVEGAFVFRGTKKLATITYAALVLCATWAGHPSTASANPEPTGLYDARSVGLAGTAVAYLDTAAALFHNPAALEQIDRFSLSLASTTLLVEFTAPFAGPGTEQSSGLIVAPLGFIGAAFRLSDSVVTGFGAYISTGFGGGFSDVTQVGIPGAVHNLSPPADQSVFLYVGELNLPISYRINERLSLGMALRIPYANQEVSVHQEVAMDNWQPVEQAISGIGNPGLLLGALYRPHPQLSLGFSYRTKVTIPMDGTTRVALFGPEPSEFDTRTEWRVPHMVRIGAAWRGLEDRLMLTGELRAQFHHESNDAQDFEILTDNGVVLTTLTAPFEWHNVYGALAGAEYWLTPSVPVRIGFSLANAATPEATVTTFTPPPGLHTALYGGVGLHTDDFRIDVAGAYANVGQTISESAEGCRAGAQVKVGCAGDYAVESFFIGLSLSYQPSGTIDSTTSS